MTPRSLFNVILKIFGLIFLREIINSIPGLISAVFLYWDAVSIGPILGRLIYSTLVLTFYVFLVIQLLFRTNKFIDILKLDQGFTEHELSFDKKDEFTINLPGSVIMNIAILIIGGVTLCDEIPNFCRQFYISFFENKDQFSARPDFSYLVFSGAKILIGLLLIGERKRIVDFIENRRSAVPTEV